MFLQHAFNTVCKEAKQPQGFYLSLMEKDTYYGGPEEGGWWDYNTHIVAYQWFPTEEQAQIAQAQVQKLADELNKESQKNFGDQCLKEMDYLDARGLDADFLPEVDGAEEYFVVVSEGLPQERHGLTHYE